jgi:hypothetical protein
MKTSNIKSTHLHHILNYNKKYKIVKHMKRLNYFSLSIVEDLLILLPNGLLKMLLFFCLILISLYIMPIFRLLMYNTVLL